MWIFVTAFLSLLLAASPARAMHISEGILPLPWAAGTSLAALPFVLVGARRFKHFVEENPSGHALVGLIGAAVFLVSAMPIPVPMAGTCSHPCGTGISAIILGPFLSTFIAFIALLVQALFLAHGGISTLGANTLSMGVMGSFSAWAAWTVLRRIGFGRFSSAFAAGLLADWMTYLGTSLFLAGALAGEGGFFLLFISITAAFIPTQVPLGIMEAFATAGAVRIVRSRLPKAARRLSPLAGSLVLGLLLCLAGGFSSPPASADEEAWRGIDETVVGAVAEEHGRPPADPIIPIEGDALLFTFTVGGALAGFAIGYFFRSLREGEEKGEEK